MGTRKLESETNIYTFSNGVGHNFEKENRQSGRSPPRGPRRRRSAEAEVLGAMPHYDSTLYDIGKNTVLFFAAVLRNEDWKTESGELHKNFGKHMGFGSSKRAVQTAKLQTGRHLLGRKFEPPNL